MNRNEVNTGQWRACRTYVEGTIQQKDTYLTVELLLALIQWPTSYDNFDGFWSHWADSVGSRWAAAIRVAEKDLGKTERDYVETEPGWHVMRERTEDNAWARAGTISAGGCNHQWKHLARHNLPTGDRARTGLACFRYGATHTHTHTLNRHWCACMYLPARAHSHSAPHAPTSQSVLLPASLSGRQVNRPNSSLSWHCNLPCTV